MAKKDKKIQIAVFGSAFNPITLGHIDVIEQIASQFDRILLLPSAAHPFAKKLLPFKQRVAMLELTLKTLHIACPIEISLIEAKLLKQRPSQPVYTYHVLDTLASMFNAQSINAQLTFVRGPDNANQRVWQTFFRHQDILARWPAYTAQENQPIHSTDVRALCTDCADENQFPQQLARLVPAPVAHYIIQHKLYQSPG